MYSWCGMRGEVGERIWFGFYQSCVNRGSVECVSVFGLMCVWRYVGVNCEPGLAV